MWLHWVHSEARLNILVRAHSHIEMKMCKWYIWFLYKQVSAHTHTRTWSSSIAVRHRSLEKNRRVTLQLAQQRALGKPLRLSVTQLVNFCRCKAWWNHRHDGQNGFNIINIGSTNEAGEAGQPAQALMRHMQRRVVFPGCPSSAAILLMFFFHWY